MKYKRNFKNKYQTGGLTDPEDPPEYDFGSMSYADIKKGYKSGDIPLEAIKQKYPLFARDLETGSGMNHAYKIADWFGSRKAYGEGDETTTVNESLYGDSKKPTPLEKPPITEPNNPSQGVNVDGFDPAGVNSLFEDRTPQPPSFDFGLGLDQFNFNRESNPTPNGTSSSGGSATVANEADPEFEESIGGESNVPQIRASEGIESSGEIDTSLATGAKNTSIAEAAGTQGGSGTDWGSMALQFAPEMMNFATGVFGDDNVAETTQVDDSAVDDMPTKFNIAPQLNEARGSYRSILADPNASTNEKLAAQAQLNKQTSRLYGEKFNREQRMKADKAKLQSQFDRTQAQLDEQRSQDQMAADAQTGITGNFARQALSNASQKGLQMKQMENQEARDDKELQMLLSSYSEPVRNRILEQLAENAQ